MSRVYPSKPDETMGKNSDLVERKRLFYPRTAFPSERVQIKLRPHLLVIILAVFDRPTIFFHSFGVCVQLGCGADDAAIFRK